MNFFMQRVRGFFIERFVWANLIPALGTLLHTYILTRAFVKTSEWTNPSLSSSTFFDPAVKRGAETLFRVGDFIEKYLNGNQVAVGLKFAGLASTIISAKWSGSYENSDKEFANRIKTYQSDIENGQYSDLNSTILADIDYAAGLQNNIPHKVWPEATAFILNGAINVYLSFTLDTIKIAAFPAIVAYMTYNQSLYTKLDHDLPIVHDTLYKILVNSANTTTIGENYDCSNAVSQPDVTVLDQLAHAVAYGECTRIVHDETTAVAGETPVIGTEEL